MKLVMWRGIIERAKKRGHFTNSNKDAAKEWDTCAVGEKHGFKIESKNMSEDEFLLGCDFGGLVNDDNILESLRTLRKIEALPE